MASTSPYLKHPRRLSDVLAAIQVLGTQRWESRTVESYREVLGAKPESADSWGALFEEHGDFFGKSLSKEKKEQVEREVVVYFLLLRRAGERTYDPDGLIELTSAEIKALKAADKYHEAKLSRKPLAATQIEALMKTASELHARAAAHADRSRWWIPIVVAVIGVTGAITGAYIGAKKAVVEGALQAQTAAGTGTAGGAPHGAAPMPNPAKK